MKAAEFHQARKFADTTFGRIAYVEKGSGPVALFVHGFPLNGFAWRGAFDDLAHGCFGHRVGQESPARIPAGDSLAHVHGKNSAAE